MNQRIQSIDVLRGIVMIIMALDHCRDYFHEYSFLYDPTDWHFTTPALYFTRIITHICAPSFVLLSGISAFLSMQHKSKKEEATFLITRGLWLIFLELTVINFGWFFNPHFSFQIFQVMWALGFSMICLAGFIYLPRKYIFLIAILLIGGHNAFDDIHFPGESPFAIIWGLLMQYKQFNFYNTHCHIAYSAVPWVGTMALGYSIGPLFTKSYSLKQRNSILLLGGLISLLLFIVLRAFNGYGDPYKWTHQGNFMHTFFSFMKLSKYPPSLDFLLLTLSFALLFLRFGDRPLNFITRRISILGRVPMFFYIVHIYLIHLLALIAANDTGYSWRNMVNLKDWVLLEPSLKGYGFNLSSVFIIWLSIIVFMYQVCRWFDNYKRRNRGKRWLSYI